MVPGEPVNSEAGVVISPGYSNPGKISFRAALDDGEQGLSAVTMTRLSDDPPMPSGPYIAPSVRIELDPPMPPGDYVVITHGVSDVDIVGGQPVFTEAPTVEAFEAHAAKHPAHPQYDDICSGWFRVLRAAGSRPNGWYSCPVTLWGTTGDGNRYDIHLYPGLGTSFDMVAGWQYCASDGLPVAGPEEHISEIEDAMEGRQ